MANGGQNPLLSGIQAGQNIRQRALQGQRSRQQFGQQQQAFGLQQQQRQAELNRFTQQQNMKSMVQGALEFQNISDPAEQDAFLKNRIAEITERGGDPRDTQELFDTPHAQRGKVAQDVINIGERLGLVKPQQLQGGAKFGQAKEGFVPGKGNIFFQTSPTGEVRQVPGIQPRPRSQEVIESTPEGGFRLVRGGEPGLAVPKKIQRDIKSSIISNEQNLSRLDRIGDQFIPEFLTFGGKFSAFKSGLKSKAGIGVTPEERKFLVGRRQFTQNINQLFNAYRKEITGAAASVQELESLKKATLNEDLSPVEFQASFDEFRGELLRANRLSRRILREGIPGSFGKNLDRLFVSGEDDDIEQRGLELRNDGLAEDQIVDRLIQEGFNG